MKCVMKGEYNRYIFDFERLEVYQLGISFVNEAINVVKKLPTDLRFTLGNNFIRASISTVSNIAEGSGKKFPREKRRYYGTSLGSARECIPTITVVHREGHITDEYKDELRNDCLEICNKMAKLIQSV